MTRKTGKRGQRPFFEVALVPAILMLAADCAHSQQEVIDRCKQTSSDRDRIACLEAALLGKSTILVAIPADPEPTPETSEQQKTEAGTVTEAAGPTGIGAAQVVARNRSREDALGDLEKAGNLPVARYEIVPYERLQVTLQNGQVWRQINGDTQTIRASLSRNQTVDIEESSLGGYTLRLNEMRRTIRVERVR